MQWEDLAIAAGHEAADLALQLVAACIIGGGVQIAGAAANRVSIYKDHKPQDSHQDTWVYTYIYPINRYSLSTRV